MTVQYIPLENPLDVIFKHPRIDKNGNEISAGTALWVRTFNKIATHFWLKELEGLPLSMAWVAENDLRFFRQDVLDQMEKFNQAALKLSEQVDKPPEQWWPD